MRLIVLGTGNAMAYRCYNTCSALQEGEEYFLIDAGGGNGILSQLKRAEIPVSRIHTLFLTHCHMDHLLGMAWVMRLIAEEMKDGSYAGEAVIYSHDKGVRILSQMAQELLAPSQRVFVGTRIHLQEVRDREQVQILGHPVTFFDLHSTKEKQFGCVFDLGGGRKLTCCGDEPCPQSAWELARGSEWMLHEAFCLYRDREQYRPYEKHHTTVREACERAQELGVKNLVLYHTEDDHLPERRELYTAEGREVYSGRLYVPDDLESFTL